jgi:Mrp family chromosome partitioning ATPase
VAVLQDQIQEETLKTLGIKNVSNTGVLINDMVRTNLVDRLASKSSDYLALSPVVSGFNTELRQIQHQLNDLPEKNLKLARMILEQNTQKDILTSLKKKYAELQIQSAQPANGFKIVESPDLPEQASFPNRWHLAVLIGIMGAGLSAFVLLGRQLADEFYYKEPKAIHNQPKKAKTESVSRQKNTEIAVEMMKYVKTSGIQSAVVAPVISTSGHSELTFNLGLTLAGIGHSVLLLDGDLCHPSLHHHCRLTPDYMTSLPALLDEMAEYGRHKPDATKLSELIDSYIHPFEQVSGLYTINSGIPLKETYAYLHSRHFRELIRLLKNQFDFILVNGPPLLGSEDSLALVETLQSMVLVADSQTPQDLISNIQERVIKTGGRLLGCILKDA